MAVTRIKNNQITDSTITYQKIAPGTLVGSLFNANLTLNSNISITGNLSVAGNTTTVNSIDTTVNDSLIVFNSGYVGVPSYDIGFVADRGLGTLGTYGSVNAALVWSESDGAFIAVLTTETGGTHGQINRAFKANLIVGNLTVANAVTAERATITTLNATNTTLSGLVSTGNIVAASGINATSYTTGALVVPGGGGVGITGDLWVQGPSTFTGNITAGNINLSGNINVPVGGTFSNTGVFFGNAGGIGALYAGTSTYTPLPTTVLQLSGNVNTYAQVNFQNFNSGNQATTDFVLTADDGTDTTYYSDFGILGSTYNPTLYDNIVNGLGTAGFPNDTYLYAHGDHATPGVGGNLVIGSAVPNTVIRAFAGGMNIANVITTTTSSGFQVNATTRSTSTTSGALRVDGGAGIAGNLYVGGSIFSAGGALGTFAAINNTPIGNAIPSTGSFTDLSSTTLVTTNFSTANARITGGYADNFPIGANTAAPGTFTFANAATVFAGTGTIATVNSTTGNITTLTSTTINAGTTTTATLNATTANLTSANTTTLVATNFSTANARITGGYADNFPIGANTAAPGTFTFANAATVFADTGTIGTVNSTTGNITTLTSTTVNAGTTTTATINATTANLTSANTTTLVATNFSTANARITGGYADNFPIGANTKATGAFTTLTSNGLTTFTNATQSDNPTTGAVVVTGGVGVGANLNVGGNVTVTGNLTVQGTTTTVNSQTLDVADINITIAKGAVSPAAANGAGLTVDGAGATILYASSDDSWNLNKKLNATTVAASAIDVTTGNITTLTSPTINAGTTTTATLNATNGNITTLVTTNFSTANARITGGYADNFPIGANTAAPGTFTTANATTVNASTLNATTENVTNANITTLVATNFSTANARITGGYADNFPIGANTAAPGTFTFANATTVFAGTGTVAALNASTGNITTLTSTTINAGTTTTATLNVTDGNVTTLVATNFSTANARITGGYADNFPIGANTAAPGTFTFANAATVFAGTGTVATLNSTTGNITTLTSTTVNAGTTTTATLNSTNGNITTLQAGTTTTETLNSTNGNITTLVATNFSTANARITGGYADNFPIGANTAAPGTFTSLSAATATVGGLQAQAIGNVTPGTGDFTALTASSTFKSSGNIVAGSGTTSVSTTTGALVVVGGSGISGNINVGGRAVINNSQTLFDTIVRGYTEQSLLNVVADSVYDQVTIGGNLVAANVAQGAKLQINSTDSLIIPVGSTAQRPSGQGFTDVDGMLRYNSTINTLEYYGNGQWNAPSQTFTVITSRTFSNSSGDIYGNVDGVNVNFTLSNASTTSATVVSINGVVQAPVTAYTVSGSTLTFTEAPAIGDVIDTRVLTTTTTVTTITSPDGFNQYLASNVGLSFYTGNVLLGTVENWRFNLYGDLLPITTSNIGGVANYVDYTFVSNIEQSGSTNTDDTVHWVGPSATDSLASFDKTVYRSAKIFVQLSNSAGGTYQAIDAYVIHNGTNAFVTYSGNVKTSGELATFAANVSGNMIYLNATSAGANLAVKVHKTLMKL